MESINPLKHTPGPWEVALYKSCVWIRESADRKRHPYFVDVFCNEQWPEGKANANLIAAAPDLLEACKTALASMQRYGIKQGSREEKEVFVIEQAIAKAEPSL